MLPADQPLPPVAEVPPLDYPDMPPSPDGKPAPEPKIEPIARHVPAEFFYIRFGSFENFLWFQDTLDTWGGDLQNLVAMRGLNDQKNQRIQDQLVLEQTQLSRMLGPTVISDVAMVGTDLLMQDGAAIGFIFEARNNFLLGNSLAGPRADRVKSGKAKEETFKIAGQNVSYLSSPDGKIRSYYAVSGNYHFVTSSRALMERFLQTAKGEGSLGTSREFRHARSVCRSSGRTPYSSISPTPSSATSPARPIASSRCGGWRPPPTSRSCSLRSSTRPPKASRPARSTS